MGKSNCECRSGKLINLILSKCFEIFNLKLYNFSKAEFCILNPINTGGGLC